ncbi:MAG: NAD(P)-binding domain-containing protein, partial [Propionibacteriaceae bacterium]|nr:NAD(P)-binding domain-containing protein [Propionibacteriaceae bacterium]
MKFSVENAKIAVIGLGYVGLPLAVAFGRQLPVIGYDINVDRVRELAETGFDRTLEVSDEDLATATQLTYTADAADMKDANVYVVTAPTPIDQHKNPDLTAVLSATTALAETLNAGDVVIYESTVYPGVTEEECVPLLEKISGLRFNEDFFVGY